MANQVGTNYVPHDPIIIASDSDLITLGFPGQGTLANPYVISNYSIVTNDPNAIYIHHITKCITIKNCSISSSSSGIILVGISSERMIIDNNTIANVGNNGILGSSITNISILNNKIYNGGSSSNGIYIDGSNCVFENNTISGFGYGITNPNGNNGVIRNNTITSCNFRGISAYETTNSLICNKTPQSCLINCNNMCD